jgi:hypothetical protein
MLRIGEIAYFGRRDRLCAGNGKKGDASAVADDRGPELEQQVFDAN